MIVWYTSERNVINTKKGGLEIINQYVDLYYVGKNLEEAIQAYKAEAERW